MFGHTANHLANWWTNGQVNRLANDQLVYKMGAKNTNERPAVKLENFVHKIGGYFIECVHEAVVKMMEKTVAGTTFILLQLLDSNPQKKRVKWATRLFRKRDGTKLLMNLKSEKLTGQYHNFMRMSCSDFKHLLQLIGPKITKRDTNMRPAISAQDRLALTLRFLATVILIQVSNIHLKFLNNRLVSLFRKYAQH